MWTMARWTLPGLLLLLSTLSSPQAEASPTDEISALLAAQARAWNRGDFKTFCAFYAEDATFLTPEGMSQGRAKIQARYEKKYDTPEKRGKLAFKLLDNRIKSDTASIALEWRLSRPGKIAAGRALIVLHRNDGKWRIVQDASM